MKKSEAYRNILNCCFRSGLDVEMGILKDTLYNYEKSEKNFISLIERCFLIIYQLEGVTEEEYRLLEDLKPYVCAKGLGQGYQEH